MTQILPPASVLAAQRTFRTLLDAMSRPGTVRQLPVDPGEDPEFAICSALLDYEVSYAIANPGARTAADLAAFEQRIALQTGCTRVSIADAAFVLSYGPLSDNEWRDIRRGTLAFPDQGATIIYIVARVGLAYGSAHGVSLTLTGPGIEHEQELMLKDLDVHEFAALGRANSEYPMGVDAMFLDRSGRVACIPRSTSVGARPLSAKGA
jgi:alpha-D-ribose 1-methylphosphonate 5-triphosphate synthase subunit PhnH